MLNAHQGHPKSPGLLSDALEVGTLDHLDSPAPLEVADSANRYFLQGHFSSVRLHGYYLPEDYVKRNTRKCQLETISTVNLDGLA